MLMNVNVAVGVSRRISCKDLGGGDCQGWLWKKKEGSGRKAGRWVKFWFVLHSRNLFYYKDPEVYPIEVYHYQHLHNTSL